MHTFIESPIFTQYWPDYWTEDERGEFAAFLAANPKAGVVIPGAAPLRKVRWKRQGTGKSGGVRVIYTTRLTKGAVVALTLYGKSAVDNIPAHILRQLAKEFGDENEDD